MDYSAQQLIVSAAQEQNILPITSVCNLDCIFCSHKYNPSEVKVFRCGHRSLEEVKATADFLDPDCKIVIGESVTRIIEGEPFSNPEFTQILIYLRETFPQAKIQITTNGTYLTRETVKLLANIGSIELNISLNSARPDLRKKLMGDETGETILQAIHNLAQFEVPYHGSIVAMPVCSGWEDIDETISFLNQHQAQTARVFLPGYTKLTPAELQFDSNLWLELHDYIDELNDKYRVPITVEPPLISDLKAVLEGVIIDSPADKAGLRNGDQILAINGQPVSTRVDAFQKILKAEFPKIKCKRAGRRFELELDKLQGESSGVVLNYDISIQRLNKVKNIIVNNSAREVLLLTSTLGAEVIDMGLEKIGVDSSSEMEIKILPVENKFFGGSIMAAGLLVVEDFLKTINDQREKVESADLVFVPKDPFDNWGYDLTGRSEEEIREEINSQVILV